FSSRRRHTRLQGDWSSDVCSSDLVSPVGLSFVSGHAVLTAAVATVLMPVLPGRWRLLPWVAVALNGVARVYVGAHNPLDIVGGRSEERRVGKECGARGSRDQVK